MPCEPLDDNISIADETNAKSLEVVEAAPNAGIVNPTPLLSPSSGMVDDTLPITPGIVNPTPLLSPLSGMVNTTTHPITGATGSVQSPGMDNITSATALSNPSASIEHQHAIPGTSFSSSDAPYQQLLQQTAGPQPLLEPPLQSTPPEMSTPPFNLVDKPINQEWNGMNGYEYAPTIRGPGYGFELGGHFGGQTGLVPFNMLTETAYNAWHIAQDPAGNPGIGMDTQIWNFGPALTTDDTNRPRPTDHALPSSPAKEDTTVKETRVRKPTARKEVVPLTETMTKDDDLPKWMTLAMQYLTDGVEREEWLRCVDAWTEFEKQVGLRSSTSVSTIWQAACGSQCSPLYQHRLPVKTRPELLSKWLQYRKYQAIPNLPDKAAFGFSWRTWWNGIQPKWCQVSTQGTLPGPLSAATDSDSLDALKKGGVSGLVTVLIALKWWMPLHGDIDKEWGAAVEDVTSSLQLMANAGGSTKRKSDGETKQKQKRRKT